MDSNSTKKTGKLEYVRPTLTELGDLTDLTLSGDSSGGDQHSQKY